MTECPRHRGIEPWNRRMKEEFGLSQSLVVERCAHVDSRFVVQLAHYWDDTLRERSVDYVDDDINQMEAHDDWETRGDIDYLWQLMHAKLMSGDPPAGGTGRAIHAAPH